MLDMLIINIIKNDDIYECGVLIESKYRGKGYSKDALRLLIKRS